MGMVMLPGKPLVDLIHSRYPEMHEAGCQRGNPLKLKVIFDAIGMCDRTYYRAKGPRGTVREDVADTVATKLGTHLDILYGGEWREDVHRFNRDKKARHEENIRLLANGKKRCSKCGKIRPAEAFYAHPRAIGKLAQWCKGCQKENTRTHRKAKTADGGGGK